MSDSIVDYYENFDGAYICGDVGEIITADALRKLGLKVVRNVYLPAVDIEGNKTETEIDIIAVANCGVFVVENKNYHAKVVGSINSKYWNCYYSSTRKASLFNPVWQNKKHVKAVKQLVNNIIFDPETLDFVYNIVIFNYTRLDVSGADFSVFSLDDFIDKYESKFMKKKAEVFTTREVGKIVYALEQYSDSSYERKKVFSDSLNH